LQAPREFRDQAGAPGHFQAAAARAGRWMLLLLIRFYIVCLSPFFGGTCKFYPSCSNYAWEAIARHGARRGTALALKRLLRCHPFTKGGVDLVPEEAPRHAQEPAG
jgi:putative membrane protein insertion efficiency factor